MLCKDVLEAVSKVPSKLAVTSTPQNSKNFSSYSNKTSDETQSVYLFFKKASKTFRYGDFLPMQLIKQLVSSTTFIQHRFPLLSTRLHTLRHCSYDLLLLCQLLNPTYGCSTVAI